jgi:molybdopterin synthase sulfur carrier subunit
MIGGDEDRGVMAEIRFTTWLRAFAPEGAVNVGGRTVGEALGALWEREPQLRGYVLDDQGRLRKHVCIFADGERLKHDAALAHAIGPESKVYVMQALSGG